MLCVSCIFSLCSRVKLLLFIISLTVHRKTNFLVNLYWDNKDSDSDSDSELFRSMGTRRVIQTCDLELACCPGMTACR